MKPFKLFLCALALFGNTHWAQATIASDSEKLFNWAENTFPSVFPSRRATQSIEPWLFRHYPESNIYVGVNKSDNIVYAMGGPWGSNPTVIDSLSNLINYINNSGGSSAIAACDTANTLAGVNYSQSDNVVTATTSGTCAVVADLSNTNLCKIPEQTTASGISILGSNNVTSSSIEGLSTIIPGLPNPFQAIVDASANVKHCTINAPAAAANLVVNSDLCLDITTPLTATLDSLPVTGIVVTPPVKYYTRGTYTNQVVADCFATDATTITDAFTGEAWVNQDGNFVKVGS